MSAGSTSDGALAPQHADRRLGQPVGGVAVAEELRPGHADPRAAEAGRVEELRVVRLARGRRRGRGRVARVGARQSAPSSAAASATVRQSGPAVSWVCEIGMMPARLTSPTVGLMPDHAVGRRRADDRAVGLGADRHGPEVGRDRRGRAGARAAGVPVEHVRITALAAARAPAARRPGRADVGPLAHVGLAEQDRAGGPESRRHVRVLRRDRAFERQRAGGRGHPVGGVDVVLEQHRDAVQRTARALGRPARGRARRPAVERVGIGLEDRRGATGRRGPSPRSARGTARRRAARCTGPRPCRPAARRR